MTRNKIYFAGPLFSMAERNFNENLTSKIESIYFKVFLPQRDGAELDKPPFIGITQSERNKAIFDLDIRQVLSCDIFIFVLDGRVPDEGACFELGIAYNQNKHIIGLHTDMRASFIDSKLNAIIEGAFDKIFTSEKELIDYLSELQRAQFDSVKIEQNR
ncbi:Nucleoside 2-deoxyribosyltransferase [Arenibacter nanhaiticus]|uniref:Nucleoside 2-deoxyribosyltransferase n=1 Tax=Arenibacter nanhaiticus TaxID=558155 RepID=A0A1M6LBA9_9FLAO|nr:nucleoside 2-deoxyribosyltransferase [Arenibacter nanhaiticus]SHJ68443.1 Nucleoside 2-deoxyribosyltransferase [Arenibacter nanhaiticus]